MVALQRPDEQVIDREPYGPAPVGVAAELLGAELAGLVIHPVFIAVETEDVGPLAVNPGKGADARVAQFKLGFVPAPGTVLLDEPGVRKLGLGILVERLPPAIIEIIRTSSRRSANPRNLGPAFCVYNCGVGSPVSDAGDRARRGREDEGGSLKRA
jgi:hypothetical protein